MRAVYVAAGATVLVALSAAQSPPHKRTLILNLSVSLPVGIYKRVDHLLRPGDIVLFRLSSRLQRLAIERGYLSRNAFLLKRVAAIGGDIVCRTGTRVSIEGHAPVAASTVDSEGSLMPRWRGCRRLRAHEVFLLGDHPASFDSRYFGPVSRNDIAAIVAPVFTFRISPNETS